VVALLRRRDRGEGMTDGGRLVLVGTPIGNLGDLAPRAVEVLRAADVIAAEDTRRTRAMLTHADVRAGGRLIAIHEHNERASTRDVLDRIRGGQTVAYVTDAGMPGISDPGERLARAVIDAGLVLEVVPGPSAVLHALVVSGLPAARFVFEGFLPRKGRERSERIAAIAREPRTVVLFESPHRAGATLRELADACGEARPAALARELTKLHEETLRDSLGALAQKFAATEPRGEVVLVVGGAPASAVTEESLAAALTAELAGGATVRDAAALVAQELGVPKRQAYDLALRISDVSS